MVQPRECTLLQRKICIDSLLVRIYFIIVMIRWTGLAPWEFEFHRQVVGRDWARSFCLAAALALHPSPSSSSFFITFKPRVE